jgi:transketolase
MFELPKGKATRVAYGEALVEVGGTDPDVIVLDADLSKSTQSAMFGKKFPDRFFNVGIAEANMVAIAAGLSRAGKKPFASSFASFLICKSFDQIRVNVAYPNVPVVLAGSHGGISVGEDGPSQMAIEDLALALALPNVTVTVPADEVATRQFVHALAQRPVPCYMRLCRPATSILYDKGKKLEMGKAEILRPGSHLSILACGLMVAKALRAAHELAKEGIEAEVVDVHTLRPLDEETLYRTLAKTHAGLVCEEHLPGGLSSTVALWSAANYPVALDFVNLTCYAESASPDELFVKYGLTSEAIVAKARSLMLKKDQRGMGFK